MAYLLDINVLIARTDPRHESHAAVSAWLEGVAGERLLFCPLVENGFLRIYGHPSYPEGPASPEKAAVDLCNMLRLPNAEFITDEISIRDRGVFVSLSGLSPRQLTDVYLLGLAASRGARFATLDGRIPTAAVRGGEAALQVIPTG
ncbi:MAG: VapC toxin family PIN domain ribonuclease [Spirochaetaceae bacterium]|nr:MAG: VapC toxin family PIN domain ribonuclease [Spirochaetaceae bacterium]